MIVVACIIITLLFLALVVSSCNHSHTKRQLSIADHFSARICELRDKAEEKFIVANLEKLRLAELLDKAQAWAMAERDCRRSAENWLHDFQNNLVRNVSRADKARNVLVDADSQNTGKG